MNAYGSGAHTGYVRASYQMMMRLAARAFYAGRCPPLEKDPDRDNPRSKLAKVDTTGLAVVIIDYLVTQEWVSEEVLLKALSVHSRILQKALSYLVKEHMLRMFERKETVRKPGIVDAAMDLQAQPSSSENEDEDGTKPKKMHLKLYYVVDYCRAFDALQLKLCLMRRVLKDQLDARIAEQTYECEGCHKSYTSMDALTILDPETGTFRCEICPDRPILKAVVAGERLDEGTRLQRHQATKALLQSLEHQLVPLTRLMADLQSRGVPPPEYGDLVDWARRQMRAEAARGKPGQGGAGGGGGGGGGGSGARAGGGGGGHGVVILQGNGQTASWEENMSLQIGGPSTGPPAEAPAPKRVAVLPWFKKQEGGSVVKEEEGGSGSGPAPAAAAAADTSGPAATAPGAAAFERKLQAIIAAKMGAAKAAAASQPAQKPLAPTAPAATAGPYVPQPAHASVAAAVFAANSPSLALLDTYSPGIPTQHDDSQNQLPLSQQATQQPTDYMQQQQQQQQPYVKEEHDYAKQEPTSYPPPYQQPLPGQQLAPYPQQQPAMGGYGGEWQQPGVATPPLQGMDMDMNPGNGMGWQQAGLLDDAAGLGELMDPGVEGVGDLGGEWEDVPVPEVPQGLLDDDGANEWEDV